ncbi:MAG TPA: hypothetical protein VGS23_07250, partial [Thermoplasmata archaeon]|nr:hypothetical protein [Thermoplasmata archaeon]
MRRGRFGPGPRSPSLRLPSRLFLAALTVVLLVPTGGLASISAGGTALAPSLGHLGGPLGGPGPDRTGSPSDAGLTSEAGAVAMAPARPGVLVTSTIDLLANRVLSGNSPLRYANTVSGIAFDPTEDLLFVSGATSNSVVAMNVATGVVETAAGPLPTGNASYVNAAPASLAFDAVDNQLFASDPTLDQIEIFNVSATAPSFSYYETIQMALGTHPEGLLALSSPDRVFVADENLDQVTAIDPTNDTYAGNVSVGGGPVALAYDASVGFVYVADSATADMSWFGAVGLAPGASKFPVKNGPTSIALDPSTDTIWVANAATITIVQSATRAASINITLPSPTRISGLLWDPIVGEMLASNSPTGAVSYIASNGTVTGNVSTGGSPGAMVENTISQEVDLIDPASNDLVRISDLSESVVGTEWAGVSPGISTLNPITDRIEVPDTTSNRIVEIAAKSVALGDTPRVRTVPVPGHPVATTFDPIAGLLVVALSDGTVVGLNATSGAIERSDNLGSSNPLFDVLFADGQVFACGGSNLLWSLDPRSLNGVATVPLTSLSSSPRQMAYDPATKLLYVTLAQANKVAVVN